LEAVLNYMSAAAGFIIHPKTDISGKVTVWSEQPLTSDEAVKLLTRILNDNGYTLLPEGRTLTIIRTADARFNNIPVIVNPDPATIPTTADIVTQIIPVHSLNVVQLVKDLDPLRPPDTTITADDSANSLVITGTQANIHRFAQIIAGLDSVNSSSATVKVYPLKYADSKALATLITSLFPTPDSQGGRGGGGGGIFGRFRGGGGGGGFNPFGGGGGGGDDAVNNGHTPTAKVTAVSDDHSNSLVVSVPDSLIATIDDLVAQVDTAVENSTIMKVFHLKNADPSEMADLLTSLYPDDTGSADASQTRFGFGGFPFGNRGGRQQGSGNTESDRMKKMAHVSAVADKRTSSLVVTADTNVMDQIQVMIDDLDARNDRKMAVHIIPLDYADPIDVQTILQDIYPATSAAGGSSRIGSSSASSTSNPLLNRANTLLQQQNNTSQSSAFGSGATGGTGKGF
jgi:general secretion pathway protein D